VGSERPTSFQALQSKSDAELVAHARKYYVEGEAGLETAKRCVALVFERHRPLVRSVCGAKAPVDVVDDLESAVYERFVRTVYLRAKPIERPAGLLVVMAERVLATFYGRRKPAGAPLEDVPEPVFEDDGYDEVAADEIAAELLSVLDERQREVVWGRLWEELTSAEIAERLETTPGNVDVIFFRAMERVRKELER
jgi:RNA polymerase sigma factor (sigma-70 family)